MREKVTRSRFAVYLPPQARRVGKRNRRGRTDSNVTRRRRNLMGSGGHRKSSASVRCERPVWHGIAWHAHTSPLAFHESEFQS
ncbi:hypothetical protein KC366_g41 [Hortaea werneckii]|nr:hypothetical protein KC366_g41 [Hortaea werneckii]